VSELSADGSTLLYSTYLGGSQSESGNDIALDAAGSVYVAGHTYSIDYPTTAGAFDTVFSGDLLIFWGDGFVTKLGSVSTPPSTPPVPAAPALVAPANADTPPQPITFQWSIAAGAASYTIQIDDSPDFTVPLVREQQNIATLLMYATTGLAQTAHYWRVRGVNTVGVAGPWSAVRTLIPGAAPPPAALGSLDANPSTVVGGNLSSGTAVLSTGAPDGGALITLSSSNPSIASVPATVLAASNSFTATFTIATSPVAASTIATITAAYNGTTRTATVTVTPPDTPQGTLTNLVVDSTVAGGSTAQGAAVLSIAAPPPGAAVSLSSSNPAIAAVPASVTVLAGNMGASFGVQTVAVSASTAVTISATYNGTIRTATLTVTPPAPPPPPPQTVTLTVTATGRSGERVTSTPAGITATTGSSSAAAFPSGIAITLSVASGRDVIWSGACSSGGSKTKTCTFTITAAAAVTANVQ
jgi:hypothetical protein